MTKVSPFHIAYPIDHPVDLKDANDGVMFFHGQCLLAIKLTTVQENIVFGSGAFLSMMEKCLVVLGIMSFGRNQAGIYGGCIYAEHRCLIIARSLTVYRNVALKKGGFVKASFHCKIALYQLFLYGNQGLDFGGCLHVEGQCQLLTTSVYMTQNHATFGGSGFVLYIKCVAAIYNMTQVGKTEGKKPAQGGCLFAQLHCTLVTQFCLIIDNHAKGTGGYFQGKGGFLFLDRSRTFLCYIRFASNTAEVNGGGLYVYHYSVLLVSFCSIFFSRAMMHGAFLYMCCHCKVSLAHLRLLHNHSPGSCTFVESHCILVIQSCLISHNSADGIVEYHGNAGFLFLDKSQSFLYKTSFRSNSARFRGGCLYGFPHSSVFIDSCRVFDNKAKFDGGFLFMDFKCKVSIFHSCLKANTAYQFGGSIFLCRLCTATMIHCSARHNIGRYDGAVVTLYNRAFALIKACIGHQNKATNSGFLDVFCKSRAVLFQLDLRNNNVRRCGGCTAPYIFCIIKYQSCSITHNKAIVGSYIFMQHGSWLVTKACLIHQNVARTNALMYLAIWSRSVALYLIIQGNTAKGSGCVDLYSACTTVKKNCSVCENKSNNLSGFLRIRRFSHVMLNYLNIGENKAKIKAGCIVITLCSSMSTKFCFIDQNKAGIMAGVMIMRIQCNVTIHQSIISGNDGGEIGGVLFTWSGGQLGISHSSIKKNQASKYGGSFAFGTASQTIVGIAEQRIMMNMTMCSILHCIATLGGVVYSRFSVTRISSCHLQYNKALSRGGTLTISFDSELTLLYLCSKNNKAVFTGGALDVSRSKFTRKSNKAVKIMYSVFQSNIAPFGGSLFAVGLSNMISFQHVYISSHQSSDLYLKHITLIFSNCLNYVQLDHNTQMPVMYCILSNVKMYQCFLEFKTHFSNSLLVIATKFVLTKIMIRCPVHFAVKEAIHISHEGASIRVFCDLCQEGYLKKSGSRFLWSLGFYFQNKSHHIQRIYSHEIGCLPCKFGMVCFKSLFLVRKEFWVSVNPRGTSISRCPLFYCSKQRDLGSRDACFFGREGVMCSQCLTNFTLGISGKNCMRLGQVHTGLLLPFFLNIFNLLLLLLSTVFTVFGESLLSIDSTQILITEYI